MSLLQTVWNLIESYDCWIPIGIIIGGIIASIEDA